MTDSDPPLEAPVRRRILLLPTQEAALRTLQLAAMALAKVGHTPTFAVTPRLAECPMPAELSRIGYALPDGAPVYEHRAPRGRLAALRHWSERAVEARIGERSAELVAWRSAAARVLDRTLPAAVLASDDRLAGPYAALLAEAGVRGIPRVVVPFALSRAEGSVLTRAKRRSHRLGIRPLRRRKARIAEQFPGQVHSQDGIDYLFFSPEVTLAHERAGMLPERPWAIGGGLSDLAALANSVDREYVVSLGVAAERLRVIGDLSHDVLHRACVEREATRGSLFEEYFSEMRGHAHAKSRPLVIVAVPQLAEQGLLDRSTSDSAARALVAPLATESNVLLSLHPKSAPADYGFLEREFGAHIADRPLHSILPAADLFVAGFSSTVRWAVATGVPVVVADLGWWGYDIYDDFAGVVTVRQSDEYARTVIALIREPRRREILATAHARDAARMGTIDGQAGDRLVALLDDLA